METHVKVVGWLWILWALLSILLSIVGLVLIRSQVPGQEEVNLITIGSLVCFVPSFIANLLAGIGLLNLKNWARILAIILAIPTLFAFPIGTLLAIYTFVIMFNKEAEALFKGGGDQIEEETASIPEN